MQLFGKIVLAAVITFLLSSVVAQHCPYENIRHLYFSIPMPYHVGFWSIIFLFPKSCADVASILMDWTQKLLRFVSDSAGQIITSLTQYRAGQILLGISAAVALYFIF